MFADFLDGIGVNAKNIRHDAAPGDIRAILEKTKDRPECSGDYRVGPAQHAKGTL